jgi:extracellular matrix regulatory protein A
MDVTTSVALVHVGFGGMIAANRIVAILGPDSSPTRRMVRLAKEQARIIDMTNGRKTKAVIVLDSEHIALAALHPETIAGRLIDLRGHEAIPNE